MTDPKMRAAAGVDYAPLDAFKRMAQAAARSTSRNAVQQGFLGVDDSRGESAFLTEAADHFIAHVEEGLGTKHEVADAMRLMTGRSWYANIAIDTVAMILNDLATSGARPISLGMHLNVGAASLFDDEGRYRGIIGGWKRACDIAACVWGGGETATLKGRKPEEWWNIGGGAWGIVSPKQRCIAGNVKAGDRIVFMDSDGIHANGLTDARAIAAQLSDGYLTKLSDGRTYGESLLRPAIIYARFVNDCLDAGVKINYVVHVTGHGWRKMMRLPQPFAYVIDLLPDPDPLFRFIKEHGAFDDRRMYGTFNMGVGMAFIVPDDDENFMKMVEIALASTRTQHEVPIPYVAGRVEASEKKKVVIAPLGLEFGGETLNIR